MILGLPLSILIKMKKYIAEYIGTFFMVFCGTGAIVINQESAGAITHAGIACTFGLVVMVLIYSFGSISGAQFNPAVTLAFSSIGLFPKKEILPYWASQVLGALSASLLLHILFPNNTGLGGTLPQGSDLQSFILEVLLTYLLMLVILQTSQGSKEVQLFAGIMIGATVLLEAMFAGPICGASMNPVRSLAPAIVSGHLGSLWIYLIAPIFGALLAALTYRFFQKIRL